MEYKIKCVVHKRNSFHLTNHSSNNIMELIYRLRAFIVYLLENFDVITMSTISTEFPTLFIKVQNIEEIF